jgi:hypothetical protein
VSSERAAVRVYGALIRLYPRRFRDKYGTDMVQLVRDQFDDEPAWRVCTRGVIDLAITIPTQHLEAIMNRSPKHFVPLFYTAIAATGVLLAVAGGTNAVMLIVGACIAVAAGVTAAIAWHRAGPPRGTAATGSWWKFIVAGPCIIAAVIAAAGLGVDAWFVGVGCVFAGFVSIGIGVLLGLARLSSRHSPTLPT